MIGGLLIHWIFNFGLVTTLGLTSKRLLTLCCTKSFSKAAAEGGEPDDGEGEVSSDFSKKTDALLEYIKRVYLADGFMSSEEGKKLLSKMELSEEESEKMKNIGFDALFMNNEEK